MVPSRAVVLVTLRPLPDAFASFPTSIGARWDTRTMPDDSLDADVSACRERIEGAEDLRLIEVTRFPNSAGIELAVDSLAEAVALAADLDSGECYLQVGRNSSGDVLRAVLGFFHEGTLHTASRTSDREPATTLAGATRDSASDRANEVERLARIVFRDGRFNAAYTAEDTEMLLNALDIDYDPDAVSMETVHETAMALRNRND
jgi:hypothetical protein